MVAFLDFSFAAELHVLKDGVATILDASTHALHTISEECLSDVSCDSAFHDEFAQSNDIGGGVLGFFTDDEIVKFNDSTPLSDLDLLQAQ